MEDRKLVCKTDYESAKARGKFYSCELVVSKGIGHHWYSPK
jgi:hypothetical protein